MFCFYLGSCQDILLALCVGILCRCLKGHMECWWLNPSLPHASRETYHYTIFPVPSLFLFFVWRSHLLIFRSCSRLCNWDHTWWRMETIWGARDWILVDHMQGQCLTHSIILLVSDILEFTCKTEKNLILDPWDSKYLCSSFVNYLTHFFWKIF